MSICIKPIYVDLKTTAEITSVSESTIKTLVKSGEFPQPRKTSDRRVAWLLREIEEWAESRPIADLPPPNIVAKKTRQAGGKIPSQ